MLNRRSERSRNSLARLRNDAEASSALAAARAGRSTERQTALLSDLNREVARTEASRKNAGPESADGSGVGGGGCLLLVLWTAACLATVVSPVFRMPTEAWTQFATTAIATPLYEFCKPPVVEGARTVWHTAVAFFDWYVAAGPRWMEPSQDDPEGRGACGRELLLLVPATGFTAWLLAVTLLPRAFRALPSALQKTLRWPVQALIATAQFAAGAALFGGLYLLALGILTTVIELPEDWIRRLPPEWDGVLFTSLRDHFSVTFPATTAANLAVLTAALTPPAALGVGGVLIVRLSLLGRWIAGRSVRRGFGGPVEPAELQQLVDRERNRHAAARITRLEAWRPDASSSSAKTDRRHLAAAVGWANHLEELLSERLGFSHGTGHGATDRGLGLHDLLTAAEKRGLLQPASVRGGRFVATMRNRLVHDGAVQRLPDFKGFVRTAESLRRELDGEALATYEPVLSAEVSAQVAGYVDLSKRIDEILQSRYAAPEAEGTGAILRGAVLEVLCAGEVRDFVDARNAMIHTPVPLPPERFRTEMRQAERLVALLLDAPLPRDDAGRLFDRLCR